MLTSLKDLAAALPHLAPSSAPADVDGPPIGFEPRLPARVGPALVPALRDLIRDPHRTWPLVLVAPWANGTPGPLRNYAYVLAEDLDALADVVVLADRETTMQLTALVGRDQSAYQGAVRVVMPIYAVRAVGGVRDWLFRGADLVAMTPGQQLEAIAAEVERQLRALEQQEAAAAQVQAGQVQAGPKPEGLRRQARAGGEGPRTVIAAIEANRGAWPHLLFLDEALRSASASPYKNVGLLVTELGRLEAVAVAMQGGLPHGMYDLLKRHGLAGKYGANISDTSRQQFGDEYAFVYEGRRQIFEQHITIGVRQNEAECISVHFLPDVAKGVLVVGHVGAHLTTKGTG